MNKYICLLVLLLVDVLFSQDFNSCYDVKFQPRVCLPGPQNVAFRRIFQVSPNNTCGSPASGYCRTAKPSGCFICNSSSNVSKHPPYYMTDKDYPLTYWNFGFKPTWWQSITWWDARQRDLLKDNVLKVNLTLSLNKTFDLTGSMKITFYSSKPYAFSFQRSSDKGLTWKPYRYFADDCGKRFPNVPTIKDVKHMFDVYCVEDKSVAAVQGSQVIFQPQFIGSDFWQQHTQNYLRATDFLISLEYPWTDGNHKINQEAFLNKYYYDVSSIEINARCHCNGHAPYCYGSINGQKCDCQHNTAGYDCERCLPLYNNKPWKAAESSTKPNPCEGCECNKHATSCTYNATVGFGVCDDCLHGTTGHQCEQCLPNYFRNPYSSVTENNTCLACGCFLDGVTDNGTCIQNSSDRDAIGQCRCKENVKGKKCDQCEERFYGLQNSTIRACIACNCSFHGTITKTNLTCNQRTGQCACKESTTERNCAQCKMGFYSFPNDTGDECKHCQCHIAGAVNNDCDAVTGNCSCRTGIDGHLCSSTMINRFIPSFNYYLIEAESSAGNFTVESDVTTYGINFTGLGLALVSENDFVEFSFHVDFLARYYLVLRYKYINESINIIQNVFFLNETRNFTLIEQGITLLNGTSIWQEEAPMLLIPDAKYKLQIKVNSNNTLRLDSLLLVPDYTSSKFYKSSDNDTKENILECWKSSQLVINQNGGDNCGNITFSSTVEWFNGALDCSCNTTGAVNLSCNKYGGQCLCKPGVGGRLCDTCKPGFFNFSKDGCQECACNMTGSLSKVCDIQSGQCSCMSDVTSRTCNQCSNFFYGFGTMNGCRHCNCSEEGSVNLQCTEEGQCPCHSTTVGLKCDKCRENFFNFTAGGCSSCNCSDDGSMLPQCGLTSGQCSCKDNVIGEKCFNCKQSHYGLQNISSGCRPCFCFNKTSICSSSAGFQNLPMTFEPSSWTSENGSLLGVVSQCIVLNMDVNTVKIQSLGYNGYYLPLLEERIVLTVTSQVGNFAKNDFIVSMEITGSNNKTASFTPAFNSDSAFEFLIAPSLMKEDMPLWQLQNLLFDVKYIAITFNSSSKRNVTLCNVAVQQAEMVNSLGDYNGVENCSCPKNYTGLSCNKCTTGYTREVPNSGPWGKCVLCACNNRSTMCDGETRVCSNCRYGTTGSQCESCETNVKEPDCFTCNIGFFGFNNTDFVGCKACDCVEKNTVTGSRNVCNSVTGQCPCKEDIGGRVCDRCAENAVNISNECKTCSECHRLIQEEVLILRRAIRNLFVAVTNVTHAGTVLSNASVPKVLNDLTETVDALSLRAKSSRVTEQELSTKLYDVNRTLNQLETRLNVNISNMMKLIRNESWSVYLYENASRQAIDLIFRTLWTSMYIITTETMPNVQNFSHKISTLQSIENDITQTSLNLTHVNSQVLKNITLLMNLTKGVMNQSNSIVQTASRIDQQINNTLIADLTQGVSGNEVLVQTLYQQSSKLLNDSLRFLQETNTTLRDLLVININNSSARQAKVSMMIQSVTNTSKALNHSIDVINQTHSEILKSFTKYLNMSSAVLKSVNKTSSDASDVYLNISSLLQTVVNATNWVNETYNSAKQVLTVIQNFQRVADNVTQLVNESSTILAEVNETSALTMTRVKSMRHTLQILMGNVSAAFNVSSIAYGEVLDQRQIIGQLLNTSQTLLNSSLNRNDVNKTKQITKNVTSNLEGIKKDAAMCKNITNIIQDAAEKSNKSNERAEILLADRLEQKQYLENLTRRIESVKTLNSTEITNVVASLQHSRSLFDSLHLQRILLSLRRSSSEQKEYIRKYKEEIKSIRAEINDMKKLYESFQDATGCN